MKYFSLFMAFLAALVFTSRGKNEFHVETMLPASVTQVYELTYYASDSKKGWITETVLSVNQGKGAVTCVTRNPSMVWLAVTGSTVPAVAFYAERGDKITVSGEDADPLTWDIGGNDLNERWSKWRQQNAAALRSRQGKLINPAVAKYVKENKSDILSTVLLLTSYVRSDNEKEFADLWNMLDADARDQEIITAIGRADKFAAAPVDKPAHVTELKLHAMGESIATVRPADADALLLYFWQGNEPQRRSDIDSLRAVIREQRERAGKRLTAVDVALTADSMSWLNTVRLDSADCKGWLHTWAPGGRMHSSIYTLDIPATPWFVVVDSHGNQAYRGAESKAALKQVRALLRNAKAQKDKATADTASATKKARP